MDTTTIAIIFVILALIAWASYNAWTLSGHPVMTVAQYETARSFARETVAFIRQVYGKPSLRGELTAEALKAKVIERLLEILPPAVWGIPEQRVAAAADTLIEAAVLWMKQELIVG